MNKETIIELVQQYLYGTIETPKFEVTFEMGNLQAFYCRTAERLLIAYDLQKVNADYKDDFLMALRDFLLVFETSLEFKDTEIPDDNYYAIKKNNTTGKYFANFQFPDGVNSDLAEQAFMRNLSTENSSKKDYNLTTDSLIYIT